VIGAILAGLAVPILSPSLRARQLDDSSQALAGFLQQARFQSIQRDRPVDCRVGRQGYQTVLTLDWNLDGGRTQLKGGHLVLPWGLVLLQGGALRKSGTVASFNPRGGFTFRPARSDGAEPVELSLSQSGFSTSDLREITMTSGGRFQVTRIRRSDSDTGLTAGTAGPPS